MKKPLFIFSNESIFSQEGKFYCDNIDLKTTPEGLNKKFDVNLFGRNSQKTEHMKLRLKKLKFLIIYFHILTLLKMPQKIKNQNF